MNPFYFGSSDRPLFGVYTPAPSESSDTRSVLLCQPMGSEYMRAHRAFRQLNTLLNRAGMNVLRFDYTCTGDSGGSGEDASVAEWQHDIGQAIDELKDNANTHQVYVAGLRWGATLATLVCAHRDDVARLVLWDPIVSGKDYLDSLMGPTRPHGTVGVEGFPLSESFRKEMDVIDLRTALTGLRLPPTSVLVAEDLPIYRDLEQVLRRIEKDLYFEWVPSSGNWAQADPFGDALIPQQIIQAVANRLQMEPAR